MKPFLRWWIILSMIVVGFVVFVWSGSVRSVYSGDITKISFLIYFLFSYFTIRTGIDTHQACSSCDTRIIKHKDLGWFVADAFLTLGLIGTVFGLIIIANVDADQSKAEIVGTLGTGLGTALYTTASGLICRLLLRIQLYNLEQCIETTTD